MKKPAENTTPKTVAECEAAMEAIKAQFKNPVEHATAAAHAADRRNWLKWPEHQPGEYARYEQELRDFEHDAALNEKYQELYRLRPALERVEIRARRAAQISGEPSGAGLAQIPGFATAVSLPPPGAGVPAKVVAHLTGVVDKINAAVKGFSTVQGVDAGPLGDLGKPVTVEQVARIRAARLEETVARINNAKVYMAALRTALAALVEYDPEQVTRAEAEEVEKKATALIQKAEADGLKAGYDPEAAKEGARRLPAAAELLASKPLPGSAQALEDALEAILLERAADARAALEQLIAGLG